MYSQERLIKIANMHKEATALTVFMQALNMFVDNREIIQVLFAGIKSCLSDPRYKQKAVKFLTKSFKALTTLKRKKKEIEEKLKDKLNIESKKVINLRKEKDPKVIAEKTIEWLESFAGIAEQALA